MRVRMIGGERDGQIVDNAPSPPAALTETYQRGARRWSETYVYSDVDTSAEGLRCMRLMRTTEISD